MLRYFHHITLRSLALFLLLLLPLASLARTRKDLEPQTLEDMLPVSSDYLSPSLWHQGMPFVLLRNDMGTLQPEQAADRSDTLAMLGECWRYDSMVSEEDWMGQQLLQLRFLSPRGAAWRFSTGRPMSVISDPNYQPVLGCLYPQQLIQQVDSALRARTLYILINDERIAYKNDSLNASRHEKFVPVVIDSVACGNELAPLCVFFHRAEGEEQGRFFASLPGSRETGTSTSLSRFLAFADPYLTHPDITPETWQLIRLGNVQLDMTSEEVRLSWGRPTKVEKGASRTGMIEFWYYSNNRVLQIWDGRLYKIGIL